MPRPRRPKTPLRQLVDIAWRSPLFAVPFALFFGTLYGNGQRGVYLGAYLVSLVMAYVISLFLWVTEHFIAPWLRKNRVQVGGAGFGEAIVYCIASVVGAY